MTPAISRGAAAVLAVAACLGPGCTREPPRPIAPLPTPPDARLAAVRAQDAAIRTVRARFRSTTRAAGGTRSADGVLVVAKPDRFRLRLLLPFGITVLDLLQIGADTWVVLPLAGAERSEEVLAVLSADDLAAVFLRGDFAFPEPCTAMPATGGDVLVRCGEDPRRRVLRLNTAGIVEETGYDGATVRLHIRYAEYRDVAGIAVPFHITLEYPARQQSVEIAIDDYELNPTLTPRLFNPPSGVEPRRGARAAQPG